MFFAVYLDLDHGIDSVGPVRFLVFAGDHLLQFAQLDFKDSDLEIEFILKIKNLSVYLIMVPSCTRQGTTDGTNFLQNGYFLQTPTSPWHKFTRLDQIRIAPFSRVQFRVLYRSCFRFPLGIKRPRCELLKLSGRK